MIIYDSVLTNTILTKGVVVKECLNSALLI